MIKLMTAVVFSVFLTLNLTAQKQAPGLDVLGYGYDVFGNFAEQSSKKKYCLFTYTNFQDVPIGSNQYSVPQYVFLENISKHKVSVVSGESMRSYAKSQSASVGLSVDAMFFSGSLDTSFSKSESSSVSLFYYTYRDANTKWRISFDERDQKSLHTILDPKFKQDLKTMDPALLFDLYGTHYIASAYLGGRADFNTTTERTSQTKTSDISVAIEAKYHAVSGNASMSEQNEQTLANANMSSKLTVTGGNSEYANNILDPVTYEKWASGIAEMPVLCDFDENSLKPIWNFCQDPKRKALLKAEFAKMLAAHPLPEPMTGSLSMGNNVYFVQNMAEKDLYIDIPGYHFDAKRNKGVGVSLYPKDNADAGAQGIDRFLKIIPHPTDFSYVFIQPQHSDLVFNVAGGSVEAGDPVQLWDIGNSNPSQQFKLIEVDGKKDTYFIENKKSKHYVTANGKSKNITQEIKTGLENQQWKFERAKASDMAGMKTNKAFSFMNVASNSYMDLSGSGRGTKAKNEHIKLWSMDEKPDRYVKIHQSNAKGYCYLQPLHSNYVWDIESGGTKNGSFLQLWDRKNTPAQQFRFIYAGSPMTFKIQNRGSGKFIDANLDLIDQNGCPIMIWDGHNGDNQKWRLTPAGPEWFVPSKPIKVRVQVVYADTKYWDIEGPGSNARVKGKKLQIWNLDSGEDRVFTIKKSGNDSWIWFEMEGGKRIEINSGEVNVAKNGTGLSTWDAHKGFGQLFAIQPTGRYTCVIVSTGWKALSVRNGDLSNNGPDIILGNLNYGVSQQFSLIDLTTNKPIDFSQY